MPERVHLPQDHVPPGPGALRVPVRRIHAGTSNDPHEHGGLPQRQPGHVPVEEERRGAAEAVNRHAPILPEVDVVHIRFEETPLREPSLQSHGDGRLARLSEQRAIGRQEERARELLGERAAAFSDPPLTQVREHGAGDAAGIQRAVLVEAAVLHGQEGVDQVAGDLLEPYRDAVAAVLAGDGADDLGIQDERLEVLPVRVPDRCHATRPGIPAEPDAHQPAGIHVAAQPQRPPAEPQFSAAPGELSTVGRALRNGPIAGSRQVACDLPGLRAVARTEDQRPSDDAGRGDPIDRLEVADNLRLETQIPEPTRRDDAGQDPQPPPDSAPAFPASLAFHIV